MAKKVVRYCPKCKMKTVFERISRDTIGKDLSILRPLLAVATLGVTEVTTNYTLTCTKCAHCIKI